MRATLQRGAGPGATRNQPAIAARHEDASRGPTVGEVASLRPPKRVNAMDVVPVFASLDIRSVRPRPSALHTAHFIRVMIALNGHHAADATRLTRTPDG